MDAELGDQTGLMSSGAFGEENIRKGFIKKVYSILTFQLALTMVCVIRFELGLLSLKSFHDTSSNVKMLMWLCFKIGCHGHFLRRFGQGLHKRKYLAILGCILSLFWILNCISLPMFRRLATENTPQYDPFGRVYVGWRVYVGSRSQYLQRSCSSYG